MRRTEADFQGDAFTARRWLDRRLAWERRLAELEAPLRVPRIPASRLRSREPSAPRRSDIPQAS
jgi:hypothetical protein